MPPLRVPGHVVGRAHLRQRCTSRFWFRPPLELLAGPAPRPPLPLALQHQKGCQKTRGADKLLDLWKAAPALVELHPDAKHPPQLLGLLLQCLDLLRRQAAAEDVGDLGVTLEDQALDLGIMTQRAIPPLQRNAGFVGCFRAIDTLLEGDRPAVGPPGRDMLPARCALLPAGPALGCCAAHGVEPLRCGRGAPMPPRAAPPTGAAGTAHPARPPPAPRCGCGGSRRGPGRPREAEPP
mmetsp:Transcript_124098/g.345447  ORF Transcript_124098/g.345447 Transcript_124098/m.345447 type:complete len:237 (-) Transcript_124098:109-819(-)